MDNNILLNKVNVQFLSGLNSAQALGLAVSYLMTKPAFASLPFGHWSRILVGQINRGHYLIASDQKRIVGFLGWALTSKEKGDMWLSGTSELCSKDCRAGEILLINAFAAETHDVSRIILKQLRKIGNKQRMVYFKRFYANGRSRSSRLKIN